MRYYIIAGEASGDLHGSNLMKQLITIDREAEFRYWGGDLMQAQGGVLVQHISKTSFMGFWEVFRNIRSLLASMKLCKQDIAGYRPDALILIDFPGFNLRMAKYAKKELGIRVFYYISPKVWAWNQARVEKIKKYVDHMLTIFPFETEFYEKFHYKTDFVGNPLVDAIENRSNKDEDFSTFNSRNGLSGKPVIGILAGSRIQEIKKSLPVMLSVTDDFPGHQFVIAGAPSVDRRVYEKYNSNKVPVLFNQTYAILQQSVAAMVVSGTATLEAALLKVPIVVCYRGSFLSYHIARQFIKVKYISLVNIIMQKEVVKELIQNRFNSVNLRDEMDRLIEEDSTESMRIIDEMKKLRLILGPAGASRRAAERIVGYLNPEDKLQYDA
jgi:lipid-A-disaccharide synthase